MVKSKLCNLHGMSPKELVEHHEEAEVSHTVCNKLSLNYNIIIFKTLSVIIIGNGRIFHCEWN